MAEQRFREQIAPRTNDRTWVAIAAAVVIVMGLSGWAGWGLNEHFRSHHAVTVGDTFRGKVGYLNSNSTAGCVQRDDGRKVCSAFAVLHNVALRPGEEVLATRETLRTGDTGQQLLLILPTSP